MTAPERITAWAHGHWAPYSQWQVASDAAHYTRHDASPATVADMPGVQALVAAAYEAAVRTSEILTEDADGQLDSDGYPVTAWMEGITTSILALTPADALAALHGLIDAAVAAEREACAKVADGVSGWMGKPHQSNMDYGPNVARNIAAAIRERGKA